MNLNELVRALEQNPALLPRFVLPEGNYIPPHAHVTEVGHVAKRFIDCGGVIGTTEAVVVQTHVGSDTDHRLTANRFAKILRLGHRVLSDRELDVEVEYDCCVVAQYPIARVNPAGEHLDILLARNEPNALLRNGPK